LMRAQTFRNSIANLAKCLFSAAILDMYHHYRHSLRASVKAGICHTTFQKVTLSKTEYSCSFSNFIIYFFRNLLQPSGVMLRPAVFSLKVYRAEDIPQSKLCLYLGCLRRIAEAFQSLFYVPRKKKYWSYCSFTFSTNSVTYTKYCHSAFFLPSIKLLR